MQKINSQRLDNIEALRAFAAISIVLYHMVILPNLLIPTYLNFIKTHFHLGVPLFFTLSGFVLAYGYLDKLNNHSQIIRFFIRRYFRIAPLFYFMIPIWLVVVKLKYNTLPSIHDILLNLSMLFGLVPGKQESIVWAGWSIGIEIIFYLIFPIFAILIKNLKAGVLVSAIFFIVSPYFYNISSQIQMGTHYGYMNIITHIPSFLIGIMTFLLWKKTGFARITWLGISLFITSIATGIMVIYVPEFYKLLLRIPAIRLDFYIWSIVFATLIISTCFWNNPLVTNRISAQIGRSSFSLYLWHPLIVLLLFSVYTKIGNILGAGLANFIICSIVTLTIAIPISSLSYFLIEKKFIKYGKELIKKRETLA